MNEEKQSQHSPLVDLLKGLFIWLLLVVVSFPENDWSFSPGIDPPLFWVFNHLFDTGLQAGKHIIFPHGPLAFFMYPLSENIVLATVVTQLLKGLLVFNIFALVSHWKSPFKWLPVLLIPYGISIISGFNHLVLANLVLLYCNYYQHKKMPIKLMVFVLTALAFYVKAYVAILSGCLFVSFLGYSFYTNRNIKTLLIDGLSMLGIVLFLWICMYKSFGGFLNYIWGLLHLAQDNSSAAAFYPHNNWLVLIAALLLTILLIAINRSKKSAFYVALVALSLFASWKHGMAREDIFHVRGLLVYSLIFLLGFVLIQQKKYLQNLVISLGILFLLNLNTQNSINYYPLKFNYWGGTNFVEFVGNFENLKQEAEQKTAKNLANNKLPQAILDSVSNASVDIYPWDYSIAAINKLNWQPRVVIQSYAAYTSWLDQQNAQHFQSEQAPEYIIWEKQKVTSDVNGGSFSSIDYRYLLNDEPQTVLQLLCRYKPCYSNHKFLLLKKRNSPQTYSTKYLGTDTANLGEWITVPKKNEGLLRAKILFNKNLKQKLKSFFYKDEQFWIYLKLKNGKIHKYRIVPKNAADGLWISPYYFNSETKFEVEKILFKASNQNMLNKKISVDWENINFEGQPNLTEEYFASETTNTDSLIFSSIHTFEQFENKYWSTISNEQIGEEAFEGKTSHFINSPFSCTFSIPLDSIKPGNLRITADCWTKLPEYKQTRNISLVIAIDGEKKNVIYKSIPFDEQTIDRKQWNHIFNFAEYNHQTPGSKLNVYIWDTGENKVFTDNFRVNIYKQFL